MTNADFSTGELFVRKGPGAILSRWYEWPCFLLFFLMLFMPVDYKFFKIGLIVYTILLILVKNFGTGRWFIHPYIFLLNSFITAAGLFFVALGKVNGNDYAFKTLSVYFFWPWLYIFFMSGMDTVRIFKNIFWILTIGTLAIEIYSILFLLSSLGVVPTFLFFSFDQTQAVGFYGGFVEYNLRSISSLLFLMPFCASLLILWPENFQPVVPKVWFWLILILGLVVTILTGRRALWLVTVVGVVFAILHQPIFNRYGLQMKRWIWIFLFTLIVVPILFMVIRSPFDLSLKAMFGYFLSAFGIGSEQSAFIRYDQFWALLHDILERPFFGWGHGAICSGSLRQEALPFSYELSYMALIFHTGIVGFFIYATGVLWIYWMAYRIIRNSALGFYLAPVMIGTTCFLIANASNPYLETYDHMWVIFLPIAFINYWLLTKKQAVSE